jgi:hypothetical protein
MYQLSGSQYLWPVFALILFLAVFSSSVVWALGLKTEHLHDLQNLPLMDDGKKENAHG